MQLKGVFPAMATPLTPEEKIDQASLKKLVHYLIDGGTDVGGKLCVIADFVCHDVLSFSSDHGFALCPHYTEEKPHCQLI